MKLQSLRRFYLTLSLLICILPIFAQRANSPLIAMRVETEPVSNDSSNGFVDLSDSTVFSTTMVIFLEDTIAIDQIEVGLGRGGNFSSQLQHSFAWDSSPGGIFSYSRSEYEIRLGLGSYMNLLSYDATVRIKRTDGSYSDFINFSR